MIKKLEIGDADQSAYLHAAGMPDDFLPSFGKQFLIELHKGLISHPSVVALGKFRSKQLIGIVMATTQTQKILRNLIYNKAASFILPVAKNIIKHPWKLKYVWQTFFYGQVLNEVKAEILVLSIDAAYRKQGFAKELLKSLKKNLRHRNISEFKVATRETNTAANNFYRKMGGRLQQRLHIYGRIWNVYTFTL